MFQYQLLNQAQKEKTSVYTSGVALEHFRVLIHGLLNKDQDIVTDENTLTILDSKSDVCMAQNGKDTKQTRHIFKRSTICKEW